MENQQRFGNFEEDAQPISPLPNSQESDASLIEVNELDQTEECTRNADTEECTQAILDLPTAQKKTPKNKGKGIGKTTSAARQRKIVQTMSFFVWLKNYWDNNSTMQLMGKFITGIKTYALKNQQAGLGRLVRPLTQIMKQFLLDMKKQEHNLKRISWDTFEQWALSVGLSTMYSNGQAMVWDSDFDEMLYKIYGQTYIEWQEAKQGASSDEEEEECSSLPNTTTTSTSFTTAHMEEEAADVGSCGTSKNTQPKKKSVKFSLSLNRGQQSKNNSTLKSKTSVKKPNTVSEKRPRNQIVSDEESEEELEIPPPKKTKTVIMNSDSEEDNLDNLGDMLDAAVQAQYLLRNTGSISQNISVKHNDNLVTLKSRGECGSKVVKFEVYPYADCLKKDKQEWWKAATMRSVFLTYSDDSRVAKLVEKLSAEVFKQIRETKKVDIKTVGYKNTWKPS